MRKGLFDLLKLYMKGSASPVYIKLYIDGSFLARICHLTFSGCSYIVAFLLEVCLAAPGLIYPLNCALVE
jgi:hypothetical protein